MVDDPDGDDFLFERLQQSASGDAAVRQLRRRYDLLRRDYEHLLDRLGDIEDRLTTSAEREPEPPPEISPASASGEEPGTVAEGLVGPLLKLRDEYLSAASSLQSIVSGLDGLAAAAFKGQHVPTPETAAPPARPSEAAGQGREQEVERIQVDVKGQGFGDLLGFHERLSQIAGVSRVSIKTIDNERATLIVELTRGADQA